MSCISRFSNADRLTLSSTDNVWQRVSFLLVLFPLEYLLPLLQKIHLCWSTSRSWELSEICCSLLGWRIWIFFSGEELSWTASDCNFSKSRFKVNIDLQVLWYYSLGTSLSSSFEATSKSFWYFFFFAAYSKVFYDSNVVKDSSLRSRTLS